MADELDTTHQGQGGELSAGLASLREDAGLPPAEKTQIEAPLLNVNLPIDDLANRVADLLKASDGRWGLYRSDEAIVTVDEQRRARKAMTARGFRMWLPQVRGVFPVAKWIETGETDEHGNKIKKPLKGELTKDQAETMLDANGVLQAKLPVLNGIHMVRLPVLDAGDLDERGNPRLRLLNHGYDAGTGIYTCRNGVDYRTDMDFDEAVNYFWNLFRWFGWRTPERDFAIHLAAILTMYGRGIYLGKAPMFFYNANIQESGKTTLASYVTWLTHGTMRTRPLLPDAEDKLMEALNTAALRGNPYVFFDNVNWHDKPVETVLLDEWLSNEEREFRKLGGNDEGAVKLRAMTLGTGNNATLSTDLQRRTLIVDLLNRQAGADRELPKSVKILDSAFFADEQHRRDGLAAAWAILRDWDNDGRPAWTGKELGSFNQWTRIIPAIVLHAGRKGANQKWDCMVPSTNEEIGDKESVEFRKLAELALIEFGPGEDMEMREVFEITVAQFAGVARRHAVATYALWPEKDIESVMQTEGKAGGWKFVSNATATTEAVDDVDMWAAGATGDEVARKRHASEWLSPKTRSSFGNALKGKLHERYFKGPDGHLYEMKHRRQVTPARYEVERVKRV